MEPRAPTGRAEHATARALAVTGYNPITGRHLILYDDRETEELDLSRERVQWISGTGGIAPNDVRVICGR